MLGIVNKSAADFFFFFHVFLVNICAPLCWWDHWVIECYSPLVDSTKWFSKADEPTYSPTSTVWVLRLSTPSPTLGIVHFLNFSLPGGYVAMSHWVIVYISLTSNVVGYFFLKITVLDIFLKSFCSNIFPTF